MLTFTLTYEFYDMVKSKQKTHEYRVANRFWNSRISRLSIGDKIRFARGYSKESLIAVVTGYNFINRDNLPEYAKDFFKPYLKFFHDIEFKIIL